MEAEDWEEKEINTKGAVDGQKGGEEWGGEVNVIAPTVHSNSKSNMAFWINDRELITLARPNKTPHYRLGVSPCNKYIHARERFLIFT